MPGKAAKVPLSEEQLKIFQQITPESTAAVRLVQRCRIILLGFDGRLNEEIAADVGLHRKQVGVWRRRWQRSFEALIAVECRERTAALRRAIEDVLSDAPRPGGPGSFTAEQVTQIIAIACEPPENSGRPVTHWPAREIAEEAAKRGIVQSISASQVNLYLRSAALQPHRSRYWLHTKEKDPEVFQAQVETVCQTYLEAAKLYFQFNNPHGLDGRIDRCAGPGAKCRNDPHAAGPAGTDRVRVHASRDGVPVRELHRRRLLPAHL